MDETTAGKPPFDEPVLPGLAPAAAAPEAAHQPGLPGLEAATPKPALYRVLARKYRPRRFEDLIGQDAMVRTVSNAFKTGRIPQAWMLTGMRGIGKTTTARILARGLNFERADGSGGPTIDLGELGVHCEAIIEGRHLDVMEIDAASHTGVDNIRQINDAVRYAPVTARYKVYIVDEVHMLTQQAFNAFLKTLEEPPPHAKFVFATTDVSKVPVTVLSRCQRFDLRRIEAETLIAHLRKVCSLEAVEAEDDALVAITRAAEGSVRDSLSLLDQAIADGDGRVSAEAVRDMLGLADRAQIVDLFEAVMRGDVPASFAILRSQHDAGADPAGMLGDLAAFSHVVTRLKLVPDAAKDPTLTEAERRRGAVFAEKLSLRALARVWQILLKGIPEVEKSGRPIAAAEMVLVRVAYAADLPTPDEGLRALRDGTPLAPGGAAPSAAPPSSRGPTAVRQITLASVQAAPQVRPEVSAAAPGVRLRRFEDVVAMAGERREIMLKAALERDVRLVRFEEGRIEINVVEGASRSLSSDLSRILQDWTGTRWVVVVSSEPGAATLHEQASAADGERRRGVVAHPLVQAVLAGFPGAEIVDVRDRSAVPVEEALADAEAVPETEQDDD